MDGSPDLRIASSVFRDSFESKPTASNGCAGTLQVSWEKRQSLRTFESSGLSSSVVILGTKRSPIQFTCISRLEREMSSTNFRDVGELAQGTSDDFHVCRHCDLQLGSAELLDDHVGGRVHDPGRKYKSHTCGYCSRLIPR